MMLAQVELAEKGVSHLQPVELRESRRWDDASFWIRCGVAFFAAVLTLSFFLLDVCDVVVLSQHAQWTRTNGQREATPVVRVRREAAHPALARQNVRATPVTTEHLAESRPPTVHVSKSHPSRRASERCSVIMTE